MGAAENEIYWVRLRKYNPKKGFKLRRYLVFGMRFEEEKGWYRVAEYKVSGDEEINVVEYLREVRNDNDDPESPLAFDVCTEAEAKKIQIAEKKAREKAAEVEDAHPVDLVETRPAGRRGRPPGKAKKTAKPTVESDED